MLGAPVDQDPTRCPEALLSLGQTDKSKHSDRWDFSGEYYCLGGRMDAPWLPCTWFARQYHRRDTQDGVVFMYVYMSHLFYELRPFFVDCQTGNGTCLAPFARHQQAKGNHKWEWWMLTMRMTAIKQPQKQAARRTSKWVNDCQRDELDTMSSCSMEDHSTETRWMDADQWKSSINQAIKVHSAICWGKSTEILLIHGGTRRGQHDPFGGGWTRTARSSGHQLWTERH